ncbi:hypothetical protein [Arthrobacter sp. A5]|uniref:hypothetical protein n=1 Tax=Arthrobacter sp. A5 TaxID=576926 RepID=UPI003DA7BF11
MFTPVAGSSTAFTAPAGVKADLVKTSAGYKLTSRTTAQVIILDADGKPTSVADRNGNTTTIADTGTTPTSVQSSKGVDGARAASLTYVPETGLLNGVTQTSAGTTRTTTVSGNSKLSADGNLD